MAALSLMSPVMDASISMPTVRQNALHDFTVTFFVFFTYSTRSLMFLHRVVCL